MLAALSCLLALVPRPATIVFVRHAETLANATGRYNSFTVDRFSPKGEAQVEALAKRLAGMRFDAIVVSPSPRALRTVAPYLKATRQRAEVWPELYECCDAHTKKVHGQTSPTVRYGRRVPLPPDLAPLFALTPGRDRMILAPSYDDGLRQIRMAAERLRKEFGDTGKTVLVVGHSLHGGRMIEALEGKPLTGAVKPANASPIVLREEAGGRYLPSPR